MTTPPALRRTATVAYSWLAYACFLAATAWAVGFLADLPAPRGIDQGGPDPAPAALAVDAGLLLLFAAQHSVMARARFKRQLTRWVPAAAERSTYVLAAGAALLLLFWQWRPLPGVVWQAHDAVLAGMLWAGCAVGWVVALGSTFMIDHSDFAGLRQASRYGSRRPYQPPTFRERWLYAWIRHPMMLGLLLAFWMTPRMSVGHLAFAVAASGYIVVGLRFEERDLTRELGDTYRDYVRRVPALVPIRRRARARQRVAS